MVLTFVALVPAFARAQDARTQHGSVDLATVARELASEDAGVRRAAVTRLRTLPAEAVPEIAARLERLRRARPTREEADDALTAFRRATGSRRADDLVDLADGVERVLETTRDAPTLRMAEPLLLLRSLERIGTVDALRVAPAVFRLDGEAWRMESRRMTLRLGDRVAAAAIHTRAADDNVEGRAWARWTSERLELDSPGTLAQRLGPTELADVLLAYGATHTLSAIPVVASFVDADQRRLREAAREALRSYRQNGIWVARETFETRLGEEPELAWGWERTLDELYARLDGARAAHVHAALEEASAALERGDAAVARTSLDRALVQSPELATAEAAVLYARLAEQAGDAEAPALLRRALAIAPDAPSAPSWRGRLAYLDATRALAGGVLDPARFAAAAALAPDCTDCVAVDATLRAQAAVQESNRTVPLAAAAVLFALLGVLVLTWREERRGTARSQAPTAIDAVSMKAADDTLS